MRRTAMLTFAVLLSTTFVATTPRPTAAITIDNVKDACTVLKTPKLPALVDALITFVTKGKYEGGFARSLTLKFVIETCKKDQLVENLFLAFQNATSTSPIDYTTLSGETFQSRIASLDAPTRRQLTPLVTTLCDDLGGVRRSDTVTDFGRAYPDAGLELLGTVNSIASLMLSSPRCTGVSTFAIDTTVSNLTSALMAREFQRLDHVPPVIRRLTWTATTTPGLVSVTWEGYDANGIARYELWRRVNTTWYPVTTQATTTTTVQIAGAAPYVLALRAVDKSGNTSPWAYYTL